MKRNKIICAILIFMLLPAILTGCSSTPGKEVPQESTASMEMEGEIGDQSQTSVEKSQDIVILYTNDIHSNIHKPLSYDVLAAIKQELQEEYEHVLLVDAGDHIQGTAYGSMDEGRTITQLMNAAGYDVATLGNHEFDYGMFGCMRTIDNAEFPYICCNFYHEEEGVRGDNVLPGFVTFPCGERTIAFVGITTPEGFEPAYFLDENGRCIYNISGGADGAGLYRDVQLAIGQAQEAGADTIIALGHLGDDYVVDSWASSDVISNTVGLDAFIDGHSHVMTPSKPVEDKEGNPVIITQTGEYFDRIGMMVIDHDTGEIDTDFIECKEILSKDGKTVTGHQLEARLYHGKEIPSDPQVKDILTTWMEEIDTMLGEKIGSTAITLDNYDKERRLVRNQETNTGDFTADALYYLFDNLDMEVDVAIMNGGGIRNKAITGDLTYKLCKEIHAYGNVACLQTVTGQQLLDALEWGCRGLGTDVEIGAFLQVSGMTYQVDTSLPGLSLSEGDNIWTGAPENGYRVHDVRIYNRETQSYEPLDLKASYNLAGYNYILRDMGDGFAMFEGAINILDYVMEDYMVLANYVEGFENGRVEAANSPLLEKYPNLLLDYSSVNGSGRIVIH